MTAAPDVILRDLSVSYQRGQVHALKGINASLPPGMVGLLGPNGAGKTTLMRVLAGVLRPSSGTVTVDGADITRTDDRRSMQAALGYLPQELGLYPDLNAEQFLDYLAVLKGITDRRRRAARVAEVLELVALSAVATRKCKTYSGGMKRRVGIAQAILNDPRLLIVDEPTAGLDPEERIRFRNLLATLARDRTVLLSTHIVDDIVQTCPHVIVIYGGAIVFEGATNMLSAQAEGAVWLVTRDVGEEAPEFPIVAMELSTMATSYRVISSERPELDARLVEPTVEDGYLALMDRVRSLQHRVTQRTLA